MTCPRCDGTGDCDTCRGSGEIEDPLTGVVDDCPDCDGIGDCPACAGSGEV